RGPFDGDAEVANGFHCFIRQPFLESVERLFARKHFEPGDAALSAIGVLDRRIKHTARRLPDVASRSVALDKRNHRGVRRLQFTSAVADDLASGGNSLAVVRALHESGS